jgi:hypothetical protein
MIAAFGQLEVFLFSTFPGLSRRLFRHVWSPPHLPLLRSYSHEALLGYLNNLAWRHQDKQGAIGAGVPAVFPDLFEVMRDGGLGRSDIALPVDNGVYEAFPIERHGIRNTHNENFAGRCSLTAEDTVLRQKPLAQLCYLAERKGAFYSLGELRRRNAACWIAVWLKAELRKSVGQRAGPIQPRCLTFRQ